MASRRQNRHGLTLIEGVVVLMLFSMLVGLSALVYHNFTDRANDVTALTHARSLAGLISAQSAAHDSPVLYQSTMAPWLAGSVGRTRLHIIDGELVADLEGASADVADAPDWLLNIAGEGQLVIVVIDTRLRIDAVQGSRHQCVWIAGNQTGAIGVEGPC